VADAVCVEAAAGLSAAFCWLKRFAGAHAKKRIAAIPNVLRFAMFTSANFF
jgi:hypothetical protein